MADPTYVPLGQIHKYAWDYFSLHAGQRMSLFNFFVILAVLMTTGIVSTFHPEFNAHGLGVGLGLALILVVFVFWKLDQRVKFFLKNAEAALADLEQRFPVPDNSSQPHVTQLFRWEEYQTAQLRASRKRWSLKAQYSYAQSFNLLFVSFGAAGFLGALVSLVHLLSTATS